MIRVQSAPRLWLRSATLFLAIVALALPGAATPLVAHFTATVDSATGAFAGQGSVLTGSVAWDSALMELNPGATGNENDAYRADQNGALAWAISVQLGAAAFTTADNDNSLFANHHEMSWYDRAAFVTDEFNVQSNKNQPQDDFASLAVRGPDLLFANGGNLTGTANTLVGFDLSGASLRFGQYEAFDPSGVSQGRVTFTVTAIALPEPGFGALCAMGAVAAVIRRRA